MMKGVSRVEGYLSTALILTHERAQGAARASLSHTFLRLLRIELG
jgi:hypothetical protein